MLGKEKGYSLVATTALNAIFVLDELVPRLDLPETALNRPDCLYTNDGNLFAQYFAHNRGDAQCEPIARKLWLAVLNGHHGVLTVPPLQPGSY